MSDAMSYDDPLSPPISGEMDMEPPRTKWPTVIGVISLIYAVGGMLCMLGYGLSTLFSEVLMRMGGMEVTLPGIIKIVAVSFALLAMAVGIVMLMGAVGLLRRRRSGPKLLKLWAMLRVVFLLIGIVVTLLTAPAQIQFQQSMVEAQNKLLRDAGRSEASVPTEQQAFRSIVINTGVISVLFAAYPVFIMVWMTRKKIAVEVEQWPS